MIKISNVCFRYPCVRASFYWLFFIEAAQRKKSRKRETTDFATCAIPAKSRDFSDRVRESNYRIRPRPAKGSPLGVHEGCLTVLVRGSEPRFREVSSLLQVFSRLLSCTRGIDSRDLILHRSHSKKNADTIVIPVIKKRENARRILEITSKSETLFRERSWNSGN